MKRLVYIMMFAILTFSLAACGQTTNDNGNGQASLAPQSTAVFYSDAADTTEDRNVLIAYFSWSGNTEEMASYIQEQTGGDLFEIVPVNPYPEDYSECGDVALEERDNDARPEIRDLPESVEGYDTIFIGYPIWWHTAPMIIGTFLENYDLTGVDVYPFTQSTSMDTDQFENSMDFVREAAAGAVVHDGLFARPSNTSEIDAYITENVFGAME